MIIIKTCVEGSFKAVLTDRSILRIDQMTVCNVKGDVTNFYCFDFKTLNFSVLLHSHSSYQPYFQQQQQQQQQEALPAHNHTTNRKS